MSAPEKKNVLIISHGADLAGVNYQIKVAFDRFSDKYQVRQVVGGTNYIDYPYDLKWMGNNQTVNDIYHQADLVHMTEHEETLTKFMPVIWNPVRKPTVLHQHGTSFRTASAHYLKVCRLLGWTQVVSTLDLVLAPDVEWVPNPVDVGAMKKIRSEADMAMDAVSFVHAPTNRTEKHTAVFLANAIRMSAENPEFAYDIVEGVKWTESLRRKARADVFYDQMTYGYGNNGIEAMAMGIPVLSGFANTALYDDLPANPPPFQHVTPNSLGDTMRAFLHEDELRQRIGAAGQSYVEEFHGYEPVVRRWEAIYDRTIGEFKP